MSASASTADDLVHQRSCPRWSPIARRTRKSSLLLTLLSVAAAVTAVAVPSTAHAGVPVAASGDYAFSIDRQTAQYSKAMHLGRAICVVTVNGQLNLTGTVEGRTQGRVFIIFDSSCQTPYEAVSWDDLPQWRMVFGRFAGTVNGTPVVKADLSYSAYTDWDGIRGSIAIPDLFGASLDAVNHEHGTYYGNVAI